MESCQKFPYFDYLFSYFHQNNEIAEKAFGRHVHWGYWAVPENAILSTNDFATAAEDLTIKICRSAQITRGQKVLDVGCGIGGTVASINENYPDMEITGFNIEHRQLRRAMKTVKNQPRNTIGFIQGDACALPFPDHYFDVILAVECIFHFPDREKFFQEVSRILKPGGYLLISDFVPVPAALPLTALSLNRTVARGFYGPCNFQCTLSRYRNLAISQGLTMTSAEDITKNTMPTYTFLRKIRQQLKIRSRSAILETLAGEWSCRLGLLRYHILSFRKYE